MRAALVLVAVFALGCASIPEAVSRERSKTPPGKVTIVEYLDFECPFCRQTHEELAPILAKHRAEVRLVRKQVPLTTMHRHAMTAALTAVCADAQGKGDEVADALMRAPVPSLTLEGCAELGEKAGLDPATLASCMNHPATQKRVDDDSREFFDAGGEGVPTLWIDGKKLVGEQPPGALERILEQAIAAARR
jgi:protein-disulfide isomerase